MLLTITLVTPETALAEFALRDGDNVVFLGESITAARTYGKIIEYFTLLRYPIERSVSSMRGEVATPPRGV